MHPSDYLRQLLTDRLNEHRILVWYDGERAWSDFVSQFQAPNCRVVSAAHSTLQARREAEAVYRQMDESSDAEARANLLIYVPRMRLPADDRPQDPFEVFAVIGAAFGEAESERLQSLARAAMPELVDQIDRLFETGQPTLELLDHLKQSSAYPLVEQAFGTQSVVEISVALLNSGAAKIQAIPGAHEELVRLLQEGLGFSPHRDRNILPEELAEYVLISELAFDLPVPWPNSLANVPHAEPQYKERIYAICERLRSSEDSREAYIALANGIERKMRLRDHFSGVTRLGVRDTFAFEERQYLVGLAAAVQAQDLGLAREILQGRRKSVWRWQPERRQIWQVAERCVDLLEVEQAISAQIEKSGAQNLARLIEAYTRAGGWNTLDLRQRLMEQSWADCIESDELLPVMELARRRYRDSINRLQERFLKQVQAEGWPPEGVLRQTQIFDRLIAPALERREKVAYVLADSLRFEMGRALNDELAALGEATVQPAAAALPTTTATGMAALLPDADGALALRLVSGAFVPHIGDRPLGDLRARMAVLKEKYGDRFAQVALGEWLDYTEKKRAALSKPIGLLVLRVPDIDELGEHVSLRQARKHMSDLLGDLKIAAMQLARAGFGLIVLTADHGHVLLPEVLEGDTLTAPVGEWGLNKRRARLGKCAREQRGSLIFSPRHVGIQIGLCHVVIAPIRHNACCTELP